MFGKDSGRDKQIESGVKDHQAVFALSLGILDGVFSHKSGLSFISQISTYPLISSKPYILPLVAEKGGKNLSLPEVSRSRRDGMTTIVWYAGTFGKTMNIIFCRTMTCQCDLVLKNDRVLSDNLQSREYLRRSLR